MPFHFHFAQLARVKRQNNFLKLKNMQKTLNKKVIFGDNGEIISEEIISKHTKEKSVNETSKRKYEPNHKKKNQYLNSKITGRNTEDAFEKKWFEVYVDYNASGDPLDLKDRELTELTNLCKNSFDAEFHHFKNSNPSDAKWLETALHTGTSKDRANAGALLIASNPLGNLKTSETLIGLSKLSNKSSSDVIAVLTDLFIESLLPNHRKLIPITLRGLDWKTLQKNESLSKDVKQKIYAYWYFENELKDLYFEFLKNLQHSIQNGQDTNKNVSIIAASKLLTYAPEKEQMLLSMLINKLGDPSSKVASKALHHLSEVAYKHPNMSGVITNEAEKLLFRNNISERAQHFTLCFLAQIAPSGLPDVCIKLVKICFSFFKVLVKKGAVNNKTMQAILRCLQKAIVDAKPPEGSSEIMTKDMQDTIYRLVHLADIQISIQTLSLLLQLITVKSENSDRFYNALYRKLLDLDVTNIGMKTAASFLHIVHRAIHIDQNVHRAQAFIKRLLQISFYIPSQMVCGSLIVINKLLKLRPELNINETKLEVDHQISEEILAKFDDDGEEKYEDVILEEDVKTSENVEESEDVKEPSWYHAKNTIKNEEQKVSEITATKYDAYHRVPSYAGAEFAMRTELLLLKEHFHPTVKVFAENILNRKKIDYYGDPLRDFSLTHFLERFAFKNPKKLGEKEKGPLQILYKRTYVPYGVRGKPISALTKTNCTEDELFIFNYLEKKREKQIIKNVNEDDEIEEVDDDEFDEYLDSLCKKTKKAAADDDDDEEDLDYLKELGGELISSKDNKNKRNKKIEEDDNDEEIGFDDEWGDDDDELPSEEEEEELEDDLDNDSDDSMSLDEVDESGDDENLTSLSENESSESEDEPKSKKTKKLDGKTFNKALKNKNDVSKLFAAADDFAELLEETGKMKKHGTSNVVFNKDKSSEKQMKWEERRRSTLGKTFGKKQKFGKFVNNKNKRKN